MKGERKSKSFRLSQNFLLISLFFHQLHILHVLLLTNLKTHILHFLTNGCKDIRFSHTTYKPKKFQAMSTNVAPHS